MAEKSPQRVIKPGSFAEFYQRALDMGESCKTHELDRVKSGLPAWQIYDTSPYSQDNVNRILGKSLLEFLTNRRTQKGKVFTLDIMGTGGYNVEPDNKVVDGEVAITLLDHRTDEQKNVDSLLNKEVIEGNVIARSPWDKARRFLDKNDDTKLKGFDFISCIPRGGWDSFTRAYSLKTAKDPLFESYLEQILVRQAFSLLSPRGGTLVIKMSREKGYIPWVNEINKMNGVEAEYIDYDPPQTIRITKTGNPTGTLPPIFPHYQEYITKFSMT